MRCAWTAKLLVGLRHVCYHHGAIHTTVAGPQHDNVVCCKIIEQFKTVALYGSKHLCLLCENGAEHTSEPWPVAGSLVCGELHIDEYGSWLILWFLVPADVGTGVDSSCSAG